MGVVAVVVLMVEVYNWRRIGLAKSMLCICTKLGCFLYSCINLFNGGRYVLDLCWP